MKTRTIILIHGLSWGRCWENSIPRYEAKGYQFLVAPYLLGWDKPMETQCKNHPDHKLAK